MILPELTKTTMLRHAHRRWFSANQIKMARHLAPLPPAWTNLAQKELKNESIDTLMWNSPEVRFEWWNESVKHTIQFVVELDLSPLGRTHTHTHTHRELQ
jgi:hypothetical protein